MKLSTRTLLVQSVLLALVALILVQHVAHSFPIPRIPGIQNDPEEERSRLEEDASQQQQQQGNHQQQPPDKCGQRGLCSAGTKGKICEVICKNNPSEGGKFCNCDTYALRASGPSFIDCNRLI